MKKLNASDFLALDSKFIEQITERVKMSINHGKKKYYNTSEVSEIANKDPETIRRHISQGMLNAEKIGRGYRISPEELDQYLNQ